MTPPSTQQFEDDQNVDRALAIVKSIPTIIDVAKDIGLESSIKNTCRRIKVTMGNGDKKATPCWRQSSQHCKLEKSLFEVDFEDKVGNSLFTFEAAIAP
ncbi:hypothetical protein O0I10_010899 [Lichtheimia ornata]|uniref:Uncharacterized protein n=1 Tax=Lichtheimia ornata TaxID=688661 RepID=A0AAD7UTV2_9FUNG|nr:uncharacterized protein O0I10_010899 [Lichtheimia ornata]KAJ8653463.1 hypothetical protein O0I10_010899 [Lichtheimia ornata]